MSDKPLPCSSPVVRSILAGQKTMTRRPVSKANSIIGEGGDWDNFCWDGSAIYIEIARPGFTPPQIEHKAPLPYKDEGFGGGNYQYLHVPYDWAEQQTIYRIYSRIEPGDHLWVKEAYWEQAGDIYYKADWEKGKPVNMACDNGRWWPSIFMPRRASRLTLEVTAVRAERIQEITETDAIAEGFEAEKAKIWWQGYRKWEVGELGEDLMFQQETGDTPPDWMIEPHRMLDRPDLRTTAVQWFRVYWDSLYAKRGHPWEKNGWVWVYSFAEALPATSQARGKAECLNTM